jgi:flagellar hook assembly protein FlgD
MYQQIIFINNTMKVKNFYKILYSLLLIVPCLLQAQVYNNEWIDYNKTYYKFTVGNTGLYRINQANLPAAISNTPAEHFQLWRNGVQVPLYTSVATGVLPVNGYIEFWGEKNDGKPDKVLYRDATYQLSDKISLQTDTAAFFLTVNTIVAQNLRYTNGVNNVAGNSLPAETYFTYTKRFDFKETIHRGYGQNAGERVTSSSYDIGEGWGTREIVNGDPYTFSATDLFPYTSGPAASLSVAVDGVAYQSRNVTLKLNNTAYISNQPLVNQQTAVFNASLPASAINNATNNFSLEGDNGNRFYAAYVTLSYPRIFNFANSTAFNFTLAASSSPLGTYIEIANFNSSALPVLYDLSNNKRYVAVLESGVFKFALPYASAQRNFVLVSQDNAAIQTIQNFQTRNFINFSQSSFQGNYLIISNKLVGINVGEAVDLYKQYRASAAGGSFNAKIYDIDELVDQFAFGIKKHPLSVKNFVRFAKHQFTTNPTHVFLIGKAVAYDEYAQNESNSLIEKLNLVPTFGWPASDALLVSESINPAPLLQVGRLAAITPNEVNIYLQKVQQYEQQAASNVQTIANKLWQKQIVHIAGTNDPNLEPLLITYLNGYKNIIKDSLYGGVVADFNTVSTGGGATPEVVSLLKNYFSNGIALLTYFGHSAATQLDYNLNNPMDYDNQGKYPVFLLNGCNAGNFFDFDASRLSNITSLAEKFVFANQRGSIGVIAGTHFGLIGHLNSYSTAFYQSLKNTNGYNNYLGKNLLDAMAPFSPNDFYARMHAEQFVLHGDPAIKIYAANKPDFAVEETAVTIQPSVISVADNKFSFQTKLYNLGKAQASRAVNGGDSLHVMIKWQHGDGSISYLWNGFIKPSIRSIDSIKMDVTISPVRDKGNNCITIIIDSLNQYDELSKTNNTTQKCFYIFDDDIKPVYPYNYSIINNNSSKLYASTANPVAAERTYQMEIDTTELFNSSFKKTQTINSKGGALEFNPAITYTDSTVYYWRVAAVPTSGDFRWNTASFIYINGTNTGYNQSHLYQHFKSVLQRIKLDSFSRNWQYDLTATNLNIRQGVFPYSNYDADFSITKNGKYVLSSGCLGYSIRWTLFDAATMRPYYNQAIPSLDSVGASGGFMGSSTVNCAKPGRQFNFEFGYNTLAERNKVRDFIDWIPSNVIAIARVNLDLPHDANPVAVWKNDMISNGSINNTMYGKLVSNGFTDLDSFYYPRAWIFAFQKNNTSLAPTAAFSFDIHDVANLDLIIASTDSLGYITSPVFGPAKQWQQLIWRGNATDIATADEALIDVIGIDNAGTETVLFTNINKTQQNVDLTSVNANTYPYLQLRMTNKDAIHYTPYQLRYWRLLADLLPEGALASNILYSIKDTVEAGEILPIKIAFKNISELNFTDSIPVTASITNSSGITLPFVVNKIKKPLNAGDTATIYLPIDTKDFIGKNTLYIHVNPNNNPQEQYLFNNFLYKDFYVLADKIDPIVDVTFDGVHILNGDIVSAKPAIRIELNDESKFLTLNDTAGITVHLRYPDYTVKRFQYGTDTLRFTAATIGNENKAIADFTPHLSQDGEYELMVSGKDKSGNSAGKQQYKVSFTVNNKPMISDVFNYPNPFTTSTAFVFTLTGSQLPNNIRIQILTVTGKIVREINKDELGPIRIGKNITTFKWDGTDMYGQQLANGVYLYRVITNLDGNSLDRYEFKDSFGDKIATDKYFKAGYGKMYLMR